MFSDELLEKLDDLDHRMDSSYPWKPFILCVQGFLFRRTGARMLRQGWKVSFLKTARPPRFKDFLKSIFEGISHLPKTALELYKAVLEDNRELKDSPGADKRSRRAWRIF